MWEGVSKVYSVFCCWKTPADMVAKGVVWKEDKPPNAWQFETWCCREKKSIVFNADVREEKEKWDRRTKSRWRVWPLDEMRVMDGDVSHAGARDVHEGWGETVIFACQLQKELAHCIATYIRHENLHSCLISRETSRECFLNTGCSHQSIATNYRLGSCTVSKIILGVTNHSGKSLHPEFCLYTMHQMPTDVILITNYKVLHCSGGNIWCPQW